MEIGFLTDEISIDIDIALSKCSEWGINTIELRNFKTGRLPFIDESEKEHTINLVKTLGLKVSALSPGIFRFNFEDKDKLEYDFNITLPETIRLCEKLNCNKIIIFGFRRNNLNDNSDLDNVINEFGKIADISLKYGINIAIENGYDSWCKESKNIIQIFDSLNRNNLGLNWDPANAIGDSEKPFPEQYEMIKKYICNMHVKDTKFVNGFLCFPIGEGDVDWYGQLKAVINDIPDLNLTIETHCEPLIENSKKNLDRLREIIKQIIQ